MTLKRALKRLRLCAGLTVGGLILALRVGAEPNRVTFPDLGEQVHYTTVKRGNVTEHISTTREALEAMQKRPPIPDGTHFVLAGYRGGAIFRYFVMEKGAGWGADFGERRRTGDWQFQWFLPTKQVNLNENTARCMACRQSQKDQNYLFTAPRVSKFRGTPVE
ncbi:cytochrome P460 family protein [Variovorax saccharolyticus]|uniref:cytochrome P460 family protein n=1 Tax=Variovorax saccharolyticus TaxID=3053516 RepID=UPI002578515E|nr:cytochrome P460 family protein [Variovorax sp. J22R187]MDM0022193.1 cytochrome P460 family protein [Variovorax sp. J22R187]